MKKYHVWTKGPYAVTWEKATAVPLDKNAAAICGAELCSGSAAVKVAVVPANIDCNEFGGQSG